MSVFQIDLKAEIYGKHYETITADGYNIEHCGAVTFFKNVKKGDAKDGLEWEDQENVRSFPPGTWLEVKEA